MPAPANNKNAVGRRVKRDRIKLDLSLSTKNGLLDLASEFLVREGIKPTDENIRQYAARWFSVNFGEFLKRGREDQEAMIL